MSGWTTIVVLLATVATGSGAWFVTPKGPNQVLVRSTVSLTLACCYTMWAVVYLAQLHPLIREYKNGVIECEMGLICFRKGLQEPERSDVRFLD